MRGGEGLFRVPVLLDICTLSSPSYVELRPVIASCVLFICAFRWFAIGLALFRSLGIFFLCVCDLLLSVHVFSMAVRSYNAFTFIYSLLWKCLDDS